MVEQDTKEYNGDGYEPISLIAPGGLSGHQATARQREGQTLNGFEQDSVAAKDLTRGAAALRKLP